MLGEGYPIECFQEKQIVNELLCSICFDVARSIMSCNSCDRAFCESCLTRMWLLKLSNMLQCPCCKTNWMDDEEGIYLQYVKGYVHRDRKCENILQCLEICCPFGMPQSDEEMMTGATKDQIMNNTAAPEVAKCDWRGHLRDYDEHLVSCHPNNAPNISKFNLMMKKLQSAKPKEYFKKVFLFRDMWKKFRNEQDRHLLMQLPFAEMLLKFSTEPFCVPDIGENSKIQQYDTVDDYDEVNVTLEGDEFTEVYGQLKLSGILLSTDAEQRALADFCLFNCFQLAVLSVTVSFPVIAKEELAKLDQRFCGLFWMKRIERKPIDITFELFDDLLKLVNPRVIRNSENCFLSLISNILLLLKIASFSRLMLAYAEAPFAAHESQAFNYLAYAARLMCSWKPTLTIIDHPLILTHVILDGLSNLVYFRDVRTELMSTDHDLLEKVIVPLMGSIQGDRYYPVIVYGGGYNFITEGFAEFVGKELTNQEKHLKSRETAKKRAWARKRYEENKGNKSTKTKGGKTAGQSVSDEEEDEKPEKEDDDDLNYLKFSMEIFRKERMSLMQAMLWTIVRIYETMNLPTFEQYGEMIKPLKYIVPKSKDRMESSNSFNSVIMLCLDLFTHTVLLPECIILNNLLVRVLFSSWTMWQPEKERSLASWGIHRHKLAVFLRKKYKGQLQIDDFELLLLHNLAWKVSVSPHVEWQQNEVLSNKTYNAHIERKIEHLIDIYSSHALKDFTFSENVDYEEKVNESYDFFEFRPMKYPNESVMVNMERTVLHHMMGEINSLALEWTEDEDQLDEDDLQAVIDSDPYLKTYYDVVDAPELMVTLGALNEENDLPLSLVITESAETMRSIHAGLRKMRRFRAKREMQYYQQMVQGMDIFILEHLFHGRLSRFVSKAVTRRYHVNYRKLMKSSGKDDTDDTNVEEALLEVDLVCLTSTVHEARPEPCTTSTPASSTTKKGRTATAKPKAKAKEQATATAVAPQESKEGESLSVGMNVNARLEVMAYWIEFCQWMEPDNDDRDITTEECGKEEVAKGNSRLCSWYYDEAVMACFLLIFNVPTTALVIMEEQYRPENDENMLPKREPAELYPLHYGEIAAKGSFAAQKYVWASVEEINAEGQKKSTGGLLSAEVMDEGVMFLTRLVKEKDVLLKELMVFIQLLIENATTAGLENHRYRHWHLSSGVLMQLVTEITNVSQKAKDNITEELAKIAAMENGRSHKRARRKK